MSKIEFEETNALIKLIWSYMVFSVSPTAEKEFKIENKMLWEKLTELLTLKVIIKIPNSNYS